VLARAAAQVGRAAHGTEELPTRQLARQRAEPLDVGGMPAIVVGFVMNTGTPRARSAATWAEAEYGQVTTRSGASVKMLSMSNRWASPTFGFVAASGGQSDVDSTPTIRSPAPAA
jgi:hypothetical protein